jgi:opacity protein-like surface antigen
VYLFNEVSGITDMKKISLLAALVVAGVSSAVAQSFNGGYVGATLGLKATRAGAFDTGSMGAMNPEKFHLKRKGLTGGLSLGWGGEVAPNFYLGLHVDFLKGAGSKKIEIPGTIAPSRRAYVALVYGAVRTRSVGGAIAGSGVPPMAGYLSKPAVWRIPNNSIVLASGGTTDAGGRVVPPLGLTGAQIDMSHNAWAVIAVNRPVAVTQTVTFKDRFSITPVVQAGYIFKAALAGKDVLGYVEVGPHVAFTKLSVETKNRTAGVFYLPANNVPVAFPVGSSEKTSKTSVSVGGAVGAGVKVAVSDNLVVSVGYRLTKIFGKAAKVTWDGVGLKKVKIPNQSHTILMGLNYAF